MKTRKEAYIELLRGNKYLEIRTEDGHNFAEQFWTLDILFEENCRA